MAPSTKMDMKLLQFVQTRIEYVRCVALSGSGIGVVTEQFAASFQQHLSLVDHVGHEVAIQMHEALKVSSLPAETVEACNRAIQGKVNLSIGAELPNPADNQRQCCRFLAGYIQKGHWIADHLNPPTVDHRLRFRSMAKFIRKLQLNFADEETKALACACCFHDATPGDVVLLEGPHGYNALELFRTALTNTHVAMHGKDLLVYPTYSEFLRLRPLLVTGSGLPADKGEPHFNEVTIEKIETIANAMPLRSTNRNSGGATGTCQRQRAGSIRRQATAALTMGPHVAASQASTGAPAILPPTTLCEGPLGGPLLAIEAPPPADSKPPIPATQGLFGSQPLGSQTQQLQPSTLDADSNVGKAAAPGSQPDGPVTATALATVNPTPSKTVAEMVAAMAGHRHPKKTAAPKKTAEPKKGKKTAAPKKAPAPKKVTATNTKGRPKPRSINVERSVSHVLARTGLPKGMGPGSKCFPYTSEAGIAKAKKLAEKWLLSLGV